MSAKITAELVLGEHTGAAIADRFPKAPYGTHEAATLLATIVTGCSSGVFRGRLRVTVAEVTPVAATATIDMDQSDSTAGDQILIGDVILTAVAGAAGDSQYSIDTSDDAVATSVGAAIAAHPTLKRLVTPSVASDVVTITAVTPGTGGNLIKLRKKVTNAGAVTLSGSTLSGGKDPTNRVQAIVTCSQANVDADDTLQIGHVVFTAKVSASTEGEFTIGASDTAMGDNLAAKINAHSKLLNVCTATAAAGVVTIVFTCDPELALGWVLQSSDADGLVLSQQPTASGVTYASSMPTRDYNLGAS